jgi:hypothetical protein
MSAVIRGSPIEARRLQIAACTKAAIVEADLGSSRRRRRTRLAPW